VYLLVVDYFSRYIEIARLQRPTTTEVVTHLKSIFARHGVPETLVSDNGPQYASREFSEFAKDYEFRHITSSPYYPQANGEAERAVGTIKGLLKKDGDPYKALLAYRSTPLQTGYSPSQLLMGRILRTSVPTTCEQRRPRIPDLRAVRRCDKKSKTRQKTDFDSRHGARELPPLQPGDLVWMPARQTEGEVQREVAPQSYEVEQDEGSIRRNRRDLIRLPSSGEDQSESSDHVEQSESNSNESTSNEVTSNESNSAESNSNTQPMLRRSSRTSRPPERFDPSWSN
jgi:hypothetical protein